MICFNPRPPRKVGATEERAELPSPVYVSILAHPERWALLCISSTNITTSVFQSSPTPKGGRYGGRRVEPHGFLLFQSSPTPKGGRYARRPGGPGWEKVFQSSPTPKGGRYLAKSGTATGYTRFQSSPTPKGGRYGPAAGRVEPDDDYVSILAHPERWALPRKEWNRYRIYTVSILAHPERWALPAGGRFVGRVMTVSILAHPERWALLVLRRDG